MKEFDYNEFSNYFYIHVVPVMKKLEQKRQQINNAYDACENIAGFLLLLFIIGWLAFCISLGLFNNKSLSSSIGLFILWAQVIILGCMIIGTMIKVHLKNVQKNLKKQIYKDILEKFNLSYIDAPKEKEKAENNIRYICKNSNILSFYENIIIDDIIKGEYKALPFTIYDVHIYYYVNSGKSTRQVTTFRGIFLATKLNKNFKSETLVKTDNGSNSKQIGNKQNVKLEDVEFEKLFEVYSTDQIEARYLLTTAFMERLKNFREQKNYPIEVLFSRRTYMDENVFFFFDTRKDHFEVDINKNLLDKNVLYDVLLEISEMLKIVDALKLDQNIGL